MSSRSPNGLHLLLLLPLLAVAAWVVTRGMVVREDRAAVLDALRAAHGPVVPAAAELGASSREDIGTFDRDTLYEYINGAADGYLARGFERCAAADYSFAAAGGPEVVITLEVYRFASPEGAVGQLDAELPAAAVPVAGAPRAVSDGTVLLAVTGRDYVKAVALTPGAGAASVLERIAAAIARDG